MYVITDRLQALDLCICICICMYAYTYMYACMHACMYVTNTHTHTHTTTHIIADRFKSGQLSKGRHPHDVSSNIYSKVCSKDLKYCLD